MIKKVLLLSVSIAILLLLGGCPIPINVAICGNEICETGEDTMCPSDCEGTTSQTAKTVTCDDLGGDSCGNAEMCAGYWLDDDYTCCSETCEDDITSINFKEGWNYVSFPLVQLDDPVEDIFSSKFLAAVDSIYTYTDESWLVWHSDSSVPSDLDNIEGGRAYVFVMDSDYTLELADLDSTLDAIIAAETTTRYPNVISVAEGWNLAGSTYGEEDDMEKPQESYFWNIEGAYGSLWMFSTISGDDLEKIDLTHNYNLIPTHAYWIYMTEEGEIIP
ncbi:MAG: hypothetical protein AABX98_01270 [Nanoarchaeota archaeon]